MKKLIFSLTILAIIIFAGIWIFKKFNFNSSYKIGQAIDSLNGVIVYYNGGVDNVTERNITEDNYNIGLKYQCVEFVKRYYYQYLNHKMPDSYGHAKNYFDNEVEDGKLNAKRGLIQYCNPSVSKPQNNDLIIFSGSVFNRYGHVAIVSKVFTNSIEIIQQNPGPFGKSRQTYKLSNEGNKWKIMDKQVLGWLRKE